MNRNNLSTGLALPASVALACVQALWAAPASGELLKDLVDDSRTSLQLLAYDTEVFLQGESLLNPGNTIAHLPSGQTQAELRLDYKLATDWLVFVLKPRAWFEWKRFEGQESSAALDVFLNQASLTVFPTQELALSVGRDILTWGPSNFRSPSNPLYFENGRTNPIRELRGVDAARLDYAPTQDLSVSLLHVFGDGRNDWQWEAGAPFRALSLLKLDITADAYSFSLNASKQWSSEPPRFGAYVQATLTKALLVYAEVGLTQGSLALYPTLAAVPWGEGLAPIHQNDLQIFYSALAGAGYTFESAVTVYLEYLDNNEGYTGADQARYFDIAERASGSLGAAPPTSELARHTLRAELNNNLSLLGRRYLFLQVQNSQTDARLIWQLRYALNLGDGSGQLAGYLEWNLWSRLGLFALASWNHGSARTELSSLIRASVLAGAKGYIW